MKKYKCNVILCGPAIGKTYLASIDDRFVDIDGERAKYKYNLYDKTYDEIEKGKSNRGKTINHDSMEYSLKLLEKTIKENKIALITYHKELIDYLLQNNIDYCLVYADISLKEEYRKRMIDRGNGEIFANNMTNASDWKSFFEINENDTKPTYKLKLKSGEYLSDYKNYFLNDN